MKQKWGFLLRLVISLAAVAGLVFGLRGKLVEALQILRHGLQWPWFLWAGVIYLVATVIISWRLQLILKVQEVKLGFWQTFYLSLLGLFFNLFFPSAMGGDVAKGYFAYQYSGKKLGSLTGVVLDRLLGFLTLILVALTAILFYSKKINLPIVDHLIYGSVAVVALGLLFFASRRFANIFRFLGFLVPSAKWREKLSDIYGAIQEYRNHRSLLIFCVVLSFAGQFVYLLDVYFLSRALGIGLSPWPFFVLMPVVSFTSLAPSISGLGVREAGFVFFFKSLIPSPQAFALSLLYDLLYYGYAIGVGIIFAFKGGLKRTMMEGLEVVEEHKGGWND